MRLIKKFDFLWLRLLLALLFFGAQLHSQSGERKFSSRKAFPSETIKDILWENQCHVTNSLNHVTEEARDVVIPIGKLIAVSRSIRLNGQECNIENDERLGYSLNASARSLVENSEVDSSVALLVRYMLGKKHYEYCYRIGEFMDLSLPDKSIYKGVLQDVLQYGVIVNSRFISYESITKLKMKGVKRRNTAGGILLGLGVYSGVTGVILLNESNNTESSVDQVLTDVIGVSALISSAVYTAIGVIVINSFGRLSVSKNEVEFEVIRLE